MRTPVVIAAVSVAAALAVAGATAAAATPDRHPGSDRTFTVVEHADTDTVADTGAKGDSLGDVLAFGNPIFDAANRHRVGNDQGSCIRTKVGVSWECSWTTLLAGGSLVVEGPFYDTADSTLAITGGTGKYSGASGQMRLHARNAAGSAYDFTFVLND